MKALPRVNKKQKLAALASLIGIAVLSFAISFIHDGRLFGESNIKNTTAAIEHIEAKDSVVDIRPQIVIENIPDESFVPLAQGKVIRANLVTKKLTRYENGVTLDEVPILAIGQVGSIWETPGGRYTIEEKAEDYYSDQAGVWFPYSMHLFGNYFIHGVPHGTANRTISTTKGSIRLSNTDAEKIYQWATSDTVVSVYSASKRKLELLDGSSTYISKGGKRKPLVSAESYIVADIDTGEVLLEKNPDKAVPIASVTKMMTALVSLEIHNLYDTTTVSKTAISTYGTSKLSVGEKITIGDLLYALLLSSSNDAAEAIAEHTGREEFMQLMNKKAQDLGMTNTFYDDASGLSAKNVSSARDLSILAQYVRKEKPFLYAVSLKRTHSTKGHTWSNTSQFLGDSRYKGGKGGNTTEAKRALMGTFDVRLGEFNTRRLAVVVLRSDDRKTDVDRLLAYTESALVGHTRAFDVVHNEKAATLGFVGDMIFVRGVKRTVDQHFAGDYTKLFDNSELFQNTDILFGNLEGPASDKGADLGSLYSFRMPETIPQILKDEGFDVVSFANNHVGDYGKAAFDDTRARLTAASLPYAGAGNTKAAAEEPVIIEKNGLRVGYIGFTDVGPNWMSAKENESGILLASDPRFTEIIKNAKAKVDTLVVSFHWGEEYKPHNARQEMLAKRAIDAGARIVAGHHPHVAQDVEVYNGGLIIYSLGNFIFDQYFSKETMEGLGVIVSLEGDSIVRYDEYTIPLDYRYQPQTPLKKNK